jgi:hypothetical protein
VGLFSTIDSFAAGPRRRSPRTPVSPATACPVRHATGSGS